jgi:carboxylesterase type B
MCASAGAERSSPGRSRLSDPASQFIQRPYPSHKYPSLVVDLEQQTGQVYNFSNIRYGQPPVGNLRFAAPVAPSGRNTNVNNGSVGSICPQASPAWSAAGFESSLAYALGIPFNLTAAEAALAAANLSSTPDPRETEDCLFLDVFVPKHIFNSRSSAGKGKGAAVLVW